MKAICAVKNRASDIMTFVIMSRQCCRDVSTTPCSKNERGMKTMLTAVSAIAPYTFFGFISRTPAGKLSYFTPNLISFVYGIREF